jgi:hypothetical protein
MLVPDAEGLRTNGIEKVEKPSLVPIAKHACEING